MAIFPHAVYRRTGGTAAPPEGTRLRALEWALYFAANGSHTAAELARHLRADAAERDRAFGRLLALGLIEEQELNASEYVRALAAAGDAAEKSMREFLIGAVSPEEPALQPPAPVPPPKPPLRPAFGFKPLPRPGSETKEKTPMPGSRKLSLRALMNLIEGQAGNRDAGQLDIYRVFVRVDTLLLKRNGIETLRFTEDRFVSDPELERAIVRSVKKTLGLDCPENLWVEVA
ncbi:MAG TPA: hypothetical protein VH087_07955 [Thermoanaerobaculia bacterium]|jgi:hypothetical protein|nr:hypothetical protein [Thermoanaerobaculia bacterium]